MDEVNPRAPRHLTPAESMHIYGRIVPERVDDDFPTLNRCGDCGHARSRHNPVSPDRMVVSSITAHCYVAHCKCDGYRQPTR